MKIEWQPEDIQAGRRVGHPDRTEQWMIGYVAGSMAQEERWMLVSLSDGMVQSPCSREALAALLNGTGDLPIELLPASGRSKGGKARAASMTPAQRSQQASTAANARWNGKP